MLEQQYKFNFKTAENRIVFQPMEGCDCSYDGSPSEITERKYGRLAEGGAGMIWLEAATVCREARTNPRQMLIDEKKFRSFCKTGRRNPQKGICFYRYGAAAYFATYTFR